MFAYIYYSGCDCSVEIAGGEVGLMVACAVYPVRNVQCSCVENNAHPETPPGHVSGPEQEDSQCRQG